VVVSYPTQSREPVVCEAEGDDPGEALRECLGWRSFQPPGRPGQGEGVERSQGLVEELKDLRLETLSPPEARKASGTVLFRVPGGLRDNFMVMMRWGQLGSWSRL